MGHQFKIETTVRNGFPVIAHGEVYPAEPDVGISTSYFGDFWITGERGQSVDFLRLKAAEMAELEEKVWSKLGY